MGLLKSPYPFWKSIKLKWNFQRVGLAGGQTKDPLCGEFGFSIVVFKCHFQNSCMQPWSWMNIHSKHETQIAARFFAARLLPGPSIYMSLVSQLTLRIRYWPSQRLPDIGQIFLYIVINWCIKDITRRRDSGVIEDMNFIFEWWKQYFAKERRKKTGILFKVEIYFKLSNFKIGSEKVNFQKI